MVVWLEARRNALKCFRFADLGRSKLSRPGRSKPILKPRRRKVNHLVEIRFREVVSAFGAGNECDDAELALHVL